MKELLIKDIMGLLEGIDANKLHIIKCFIEGIKK